ncbi:hypothetical protein PPACK8108_LOCUS3588 [Phakopsora pachyrhizi]|uniref:Uncharacterized protein n=1 Tax=Phakopsora pachyrhizi TaxID=170000 RepID=A0AAV0AKW7_PHAPC|nr:hypothetical protein PPACK8108_LOCUS3588 [Phakopsora pachyrhizi]
MVRVLRLAMGLNFTNTRQKIPKIESGCKMVGYPLLSHTNDTPPPMDKTPQAEHHFSSLAKNQDITPITKDNKRNLNDAFENAEDRPMKLAGIERKHYSLPQFSFNRGDFSNERDTFPTQTMNSHSSDVERDYATALKGSNRRYNDRVFGNNYISEHNHGLVVQPESLDAPYRIISNGAIETRVQEHHNLGEWILPMNIDLNRLFTSETTAGITGDSNNFLANNFKLSQQEEAKELDGEGKIPNRIFENHHSLHFKNDLKSLQKTRTKETNNNSMDRVDLPLSVKHQSQSLYLGNKDELDKIGLAKTSRSSSKASKKQNNAIRKKIKNDLMKDKGNKIRWISGQEKTFEDVPTLFVLRDYRQLCRQ